MIQKIKNKILNGFQIEKEDAMRLIDADPEEISAASNELRQHFCGNIFDICAIINGKNGRCPEDCKFCAQSAHYKVPIEEYPLLDCKSILKDATLRCEKGILRYSIVTSGKKLAEDELESVCNCYKEIRKNTNIFLCASHGLLSLKQLLKLRNAGVKRYHINLETSRRNFPNICTTHSYGDKINTIKAAQKAGLEVCSGGIIGLGETMEDRIDLAYDIRELGVKSVPVNILSPIPETPYGKFLVLTANEVRKTVAIFRFILPDAAIRLAGGRNLMPDKGRSLFLSGSNAAITGDMLTTSGITVDDDMKMIKELKFDVKMM